MAVNPILSRLPNNFGVVRLALAFSVIVSHSPELVDGNRSRELLTRLFGTASLGEVAVAGFFVISGYLISKSFMQTESIFSYFFRRIARIVPGFAVAFCFSVIIAASVAPQGIWSSAVIFELGAQLITLRPPSIVGVFEGMPHPLINGSLWTIAYEFRCYVAAAVFGALGMYRSTHRLQILVITFALLVADAVDVAGDALWPASSLLGRPDAGIRFLGFFCVGVCYNVFQDKIRFSGIGVSISTTTLICLMFSEHMHRASLAILGGYIILWFSIEIKQIKFTSWTDSLDLSYGIYLYSWPIQSIIIWYCRDISPWVLCVVATLLSLVMAIVSFALIERPCQLFAKRCLGFRALRAGGVTDEGAKVQAGAGCAAP